jgi:phospholipase A-2-activating protein
VWGVTHNHLGDIITGSEDYKVRTFTRDASRADQGEALQEFEAECKTASAGQHIDVDKLPSVSALAQTKGKEGEVKVFKDGTNPVAFMWKGNTWEKIGDVIVPPGGGAQGGQTKFYEGDRIFKAGDYDHVFDVDLGDNIMRRLPHNNGENPMEAAEKFMARENLGRAYNEQITNFVKQNSLPHATRDVVENVDMVETEVKKLTSKSIPMKKMLFFDSVSCEGPFKKIKEIN